MTHSVGNEFDTPALRDFLDRWQSGDRSAADDLLRRAGNRLEKLAGRMCRSFPNVREWTETSDILQGSLIRLLRTLQSLRPATTRDFFQLAAVHIRRELLDLARIYSRKGWLPLDRHPADASESGRPGATDRASSPVDDFELWANFHEAVDLLPVEEREVVGLVFYHGWTQARIAALFQVDERTIRRRWSSACTQLRQLLRRDVPSG